MSPRDAPGNAPSPREVLDALRAKLVGVRQDVARQAADTTDGNALASLAKDLKDVQEQIEAVDRAVADEARREPKVVGFTGR